MNPILKRLPGKRAFVTGAGSGLGRAVSHQLARQGWNIAIQDIHEANARETLGQVEALGGRGTVYVFDVADLEAFTRAGLAFADAHGGIDLVVNNAGVAVIGPIGEVAKKEWDWILGVNLLGPIHGCSIFVPLLKRQGSGHVVNIASLAGLISAPNMGPYNTTKFAVVGLSEALRAELHGTGVSASVVCPSFFKTNIGNNMRTQDSSAMKLGEALMEKSKLSADDVARIILEGVEKDRFYILPHPEGRLAWWIKRLTPSLMVWFLGRANQKTLAEKLVRRGKA